MQIHLIPNQDGVKQWILIELQGGLESCSGEIRGQLMVGNLCWDNDTAVFVLGHQVVEGKAKTLDKPFVVLAKGEKTTENEVVAIIRKKILFSLRPKPIVFKQLSS
ncbi:unnamed protein product [Anisakis simplex]|uniref:Ctf8 n=1 Tax=Anisakis simplex TaxID=6269 RepID=A0A0M3JZK4_ANISI|nr:unnamed protein product [Anisakis simplex]